MKKVRSLLRLALCAGLLLLAGGSVIASHERAAGWSHEGLDHPPSAVHATLLDHLRFLAGQLGEDQQAGRPAFSPAPAALTLATTVLALFAFRATRPWRPSALGVGDVRVEIPLAQRALAPARRPPQSTSSSA